MRKLFLGLAVLSVLAFAGCKPAAETPATTDTTTPAVTDTAPVTPAPVDVPVK